MPVPHDRFAQKTLPKAEDTKPGLKATVGRIKKDEDRACPTYKYNREVTERLIIRTPACRQLIEDSRIEVVHAAFFPSRRMKPERK
ncbi:cellular nucleic acid-binding protein [Plakobranchus ocellatus]|uniref:Cellular nucleic acid-binding protein n=1 Tax=Plakobranchus ocellatus TaxID=259542 RepID=A0AAV3YND9_9GAST|nr:cellular nucleic acid-binding protein [Plakobranchus ocellatus]